MEISEELEKDIRELQDKIAAALDYSLELQRRHGKEYLPDLEMVEDRLLSAISWAEGSLEPPVREDEDDEYDDETLETLD